MCWLDISENDRLLKVKQIKIYRCDDFKIHLLTAATTYMENICAVHSQKQQHYIHNITTII